MTKQAKRLIKRFLIKTVQPPVRGCMNLMQRIATMTDQDQVVQEPKLTTAVDYLNYWHLKTVNEVEKDFGHISVPGFPSARPQYVWGVVSGVYLAKALGIKCISVIEFGVAGGNGLVILEAIAEKVSLSLGIDIDVYGFDTGTGSPKPKDYRDVPNLLAEGVYPMDIPKLQKRLKKAKLELGLVEDTVPAFIQARPAPVAFAAFDFAQYSPTLKALKLFEAEDEVLLPRIQCYFTGSMGLAFSDFTADRAAIAEFNATHSLRKISPCRGLDVIAAGSQQWARRFWLAHIFEHKQYGVYDGIIKILDNPLIV